MSHYRQIQLANSVSPIFLKPWVRETRLLSINLKQPICLAQRTMADAPSTKRQKLSASEAAYMDPVGPLQRSISPPSLHGGTSDTFGSHTEYGGLNTLRTIASPVQLSSVDGIPADCNIDTVSLKDIVGHPLIKECWAFNYLVDVDFLL